MAEVGCLKDGNFQNLVVEGRTTLKSPIILNGGKTINLTEGDSGATCVFDHTDASVFVLPLPRLGMHFTFITTVTATGDHEIKTNQGVGTTHGFLGGLGSFNTTVAAGGDAFGAATAGTDDFITMNGVATGGLAGTYIRVFAILDASDEGCWGVAGHVISDGGISLTPFASS